MIDPLHTLLADTLRYSDTFMFGYSQCCPLSEESKHIATHRIITAGVLNMYDYENTKSAEVKCDHCGRLVSESVNWTCGCGRTTKPESRIAEYKSIVQGFEESLRIRFEVHMESENKIQELKELNAKLHKANEELAAYIGKLEARNE